MVRNGQGLRRRCGCLSDSDFATAGHLEKCP